MPKMKALQCALALEIRSISCPRLQLKDKEDVYLSVCVFGQYKKTQCVPPVFPLVFNARMVFEKVFPEAIDPGDVVAQLEYDTAVFELIQLVLPVGETLSIYEENTRDFMFPGPKQMSGHHDSNRQVMMQRISGIRGLAPKMEFSTTSVITECLISSRKCRGLQAQEKPSYHATPLERSHGRMQIRGSTRSSKKKSRSPERHKYYSNPRNYEQPTISSKSHSPSPYTKRRMCELSEDTRRRLAHLNLGPYEFKKETDKPPFVIRHVCAFSRACVPSEGCSSAMSPQCSGILLPQVYQPSPGKSHVVPGRASDAADPPSPKPEILLGPNVREPSREGWCKLHNGELGPVCTDHTHPGSYRSKDYKITNPSHGRDREDSLERCEEYVTRQSRPHHTDRILLVHSAPSSMQKRSPSPVLNQSTLRERYHSDWCSPANSDEIHERVKNVLKSHGAHQRCLYVSDETDQEKDEELDLKRSFSYKDSVCDSDPEYRAWMEALGDGSARLSPSFGSSVYRPHPLVHLDNGEYWSNRAAAYKGKSHRGNFENSMDKIYRNLYRKACGSSTQESF
ncbi:spermatogenesis-associated protein 6 isoform X2 [Sminthopsis crassicaudata]|uniref:spermatogenesis-associated protein 6 isoform X2 n=1 Tax=Sminthopsis crassicaudata TaxID=9301 RepID=UPI003D684F86